MVEALVKFFLQRLNSILLHENHIFSGLELEIQRLISALGEIGDLCCTKGGACAAGSWVNELRKIIRDTDDLVDEFIIQMDQQNSSNRSVLTNFFTNGLQQIESRLATTVHRMTQLNNSTTFKGGCEDDKNNPQEIDGQISAHGNPAAIGRKEKVNEEHSHEIDESQTAEAKNSITIGEAGELDNSREMEGGRTSSPDASQVVLNYIDLPYYLQYCLMYCCAFPENYQLSKGKLIRLMVAEGLIQEKAGQLMEDTAEENIGELINKGILQVNHKNMGDGVKLKVNPDYREFILCKMKEENFITTCNDSNSSIPHTAFRVLVYTDMKTIAARLNNSRTRSLFLMGSQDLSTDHGNWLSFDGAKFLRILDLERTKIESLPDEVGDLIHLTYICLKHTDVNKLPSTLGNLRALQTLDIKWCGDLSTLPAEVLNLVHLRHIKMYKRLNVGAVKLPPGIERLGNLLSLTGIHAGSGIARELSNLIHLRRLGVMDVDKEDVSDLFASIMKMQCLLSLSLEAKHACYPETLVLLESFLPPPLIEKLRLEGRLENIPSWLGSMESLSKLRLGFSHLSENPALVLQVLPNLKILTLWHAYDGKQIGKEFCRVGGFPKLEVLTIASHVLEEWTEIEDGALPSLQYLHLHNCLKLRLLPEGLQFVTTLKQLNLLPLLDEHVERLKPDGGEENYKIKHIPQISLLPISILRNICPLPPCAPPEDGEMSE